MTKTLICTILFLIINAQSGVLNLDSFLIAEISDEELKISEAKLQELQIHEKDTKLWDELQFRYEADRMDMREHNFEIRVSPLRFGERDAEQQRFQTRIQFMKLRTKILRDKIRARRYKNAVEYIFRLKQLKVTERLQEVWSDRIKVHMSRIGSENFQPTDLISAQDKQVELESDLLDLHRKIWNSKQKLIEGMINVDSLAVDTDLLMSHLQIRDYVSPMRPADAAQDTNSPYAQLSRIRLESARTKYDVQMAQENDWISYVKAGYKLELPKDSEDPIESGPKNWSAGIGIKIPLFSGRDQGLINSRMDLMEARANHTEEMHKLNEEMEDLRLDIDLLIQRLELLSGHKKKADEGKLFDAYAEMASLDPLILLKARESSLLSSLQEIKLNYQIFLKYLEILELNGDFGKFPQRNLLHPQR
jgi:hypothetical protein